MTFSPDTTVGTLTERFPRTIHVFRRFGIEFCCGPGRSLGEACRRRGLNFDEVAAALIVAAADPYPGWSGRPLSDLTEHIVENFHAPMRQELPRLQHAASALQGHGGVHEEAVDEIIRELSRLLPEFMRDVISEERDLFPLIDRLATGMPAPSDPAVFAFFRRALSTTRERTDLMVQRLRQITTGYHPAPTACPAVRSLYAGLAEFDALLHQHMQLEMEVLLPRAAALLTGFEKEPPARSSRSRGQEE